MFSSSVKVKGGSEYVLASFLSKVLCFKHTFSGSTAIIKIPYKKQQLRESCRDQQGCRRGRVAPTLLLWRSGQETVKIRGWRDWAFTLCPAETIHPLTHPLIFPLPSCPILSLPFRPFSRPPLLSRAGRDAQVLPGRGGSPSCLHGARSSYDLFPPTDDSILPVATQTRICLATDSQMPHFTVRKPGPERGSVTHLKSHSYLRHNHHPWIKLKITAL